MVERCPECNAVLEQYDDETIGLCIIVLATYIHREPSLATPVLLESLIAVSRYAYLRDIRSVTLFQYIFTTKKEKGHWGRIFVWILRLVKIISLILS